MDSNSNFKMLEIRNVSKIYKTKGGVNTKALDDVSISFGQRGLVFLLGKSGSGKSTLLNVSGGLDEPTSGEIIVKGKSSKDFSGADFDSYRNTFVGFIFQEYNILDEFNVEDNIALALELQGRPKDREKINKLLRDVELEQYAKRKPNTLSGGQKQRIAIARALVKDPQIIMADEPTGALDSATGKQVFDTLKKLSETRLVIVVSHDREFAEIYGDRIVELKDGKIISDVSKSHVPPKEIDKNITVIGGNTLSIKQGATLTAENIKTIQDFIKNTDGDLIISNGKSEIENFKKANRMSENGSTEKFDDTKAEALADKQYSKEESKFIRSRLPAAKAIKIGASGLKLKPVRLVFTILLSFIAFTMFGLFSTLMTYNGLEVAANSFAESGYEYLNISKLYRSEVTNTRGNDSYSYTDYDYARFTDEELETYRASYGASSYGYFSVSAEIDNVATTGDKYTSYYQAGLQNYAYVPEGNPILNNLQGEYPTATDELCISTYMLDVFKNSTLCRVTLDKNGRPNDYSTKDTVVVNSANDVIGQYIVLKINYSYEQVFKITGVFDSGEIDAKYDAIKEGNVTNYQLVQEFTNLLSSESTHKMALVSDGFYDEYAELFEQQNNYYVEYFDYTPNFFSYNYVNYEFDYETQTYIPNGDAYSFGIGNSVRAFGGEDQLEVKFFGAEKSSLAEDEMVLNLDTVINLNEVQNAVIYNIYLAALDGEFKDEGFDPADYEGNGGGMDMTELMIYQAIYFAQRYYTENCNLYELYRGYMNGYVYVNYYDEEENRNYSEQVYLTKEERQQALETLLEILCDCVTSPISLELTIDDISTFDMKLVGFYIPLTEYGSNGIYFSQSFIDGHVTTYSYDKTVTVRETKYVQSPDEKYSGIMLEYDGTAETYKALATNIGMDNADENDVFISINNSLYMSVEMANMYAEMLSTVFLWVGVVFAVFSALLLFNFISMSISNKRKEIGILRAVGARGLDVFKIFFAESGIIVGVCTVLAIVGTVAACAIINTVLKTELGLGVTLFVFGVVSVAMMVGIAVLVALIATFLPVFFASRKKPVESIRAL